MYAEGPESECGVGLQILVGRQNILVGRPS